MKKIILVTNSFWNIVNFRQDLIKKLLEKNIKLILSSPPDSNLKKYDLSKIDYLPINYRRNTINIFENIYIIFFYLKKIFRHDPSVALIYTIKPNIFFSISALISLKKIKIYNFITGIGNLYFHGKLKKRLIFYLYKIAFLKSSKVIFQNVDDLNYFVLNKIVKKEKCLIIPGSGVDILKFKFKSLKNNPSENFNFLCVTRLIKHKGIEELTKAAKLVKEEFPYVTFTLVGSFDDQYSSQINTKLKNELRLIFKRIKYTENVADLINDCDCFVLPSYREGTSRALLEAASVGRPIITSNVPGCNNIVLNDFNGYLCEPRNVISLYECLIKMINTDFDKRNKMSINSRNYIKKEFEVNIINKKILETIEI